MLSISKIVLQDAAEALHLASDPLLEPQLFAAFPKPMRKAHADAIRDHRLRNEIIATKVANRFVNRLGPGVAFDLTEEEGASLQQVIAAFLVAERLLDLDKLWAQIEQATLPESVRIELFSIAADERAALTSPTSSARPAARPVSVSCASCSNPAFARSRRRRPNSSAPKSRNEAVARRDRLIALGASEEMVRGLVRLFELDGVFAIAALAARHKFDELSLTRAYTKLGEALGLDWAQQQVGRFVPTDQWDRLLTAGLARDFEQLRIEFLSRMPGGEPDEAVDAWIEGAAGRGSSNSAGCRPRPRRRACQRADARTDRQPGRESCWRDKGAAQPKRWANSHCRMADVRFGVFVASRRSTSISATSAFKVHPRSRAAASSACQNIGSRLIEVAWPAISTERLRGGA